MAYEDWPSVVAERAKVAAYWTPERRAEHSARMKQIWEERGKHPRKGTKHKDDARARQSQRMKELWADPEWRAKAIAARRQSDLDLEEKWRQRAETRKLLEDLL